MKMFSLIVLILFSVFGPAYAEEPVPMGETQTVYQPTSPAGNVELQNNGEVNPLPSGSLEDAPALSRDNPPAEMTQRPKPEIPEIVNIPTTAPADLIRGGGLTIQAPGNESTLDYVLTPNPQYLTPEDIKNFLDDLKKMTPEELRQWRERKEQEGGGLSEIYWYELIA